MEESPAPNELINEPLDINDLPQHLAPLKRTDRFYGTLEKKDGKYIVQAEPHVMLLVRRLFNATNDDASGIAEIPANRRFLGDLNWLMMRFPLKILDEKEWLNDMKLVTTYETKKKEMEKQLQQVEVSPLLFNGKLYDYQKQGVSFFLENKRCILGDVMGLGKYIQTLAFITQPNTLPCLIVVQPHMIRQSYSEIKKFLGDGPKVHILKGLTPSTLPPADIYLVHYLVFRGWYKELSMINFKTVIFDECQELRLEGSSKYSTIQQFIKATNPEYRIGLSGTPIYNYGGEFYSILNIIEENCLGAYKYFVKEWCSPYDYRMIEKPDAFGSYLRREGLLLRRREEDVALELPPKRRSIQKIDLDGKVYLQHMESTTQILSKMENAEKADMATLMLEAVGSARKATGVAKAPAVCEFVRPLLEASVPVLLFAFHHNVMDYYNGHLHEFNPKFVTGRETLEEKQQNIDEFMKGFTNCLVLNLRTSTGLNLQRASVVVFGELDWSPAVHYQAEDRAHRIGQKHSVMSYYLHAEGTTDDEMMKCLDIKTEQSIKILNDRPITESDKSIDQHEASKFMWNIIDNLKKGFYGRDAMLR